MSEDPIKLFATRAERYPQPTEADAVQGATRTALAAIPFVGGSITEFLSMVLAPAVTRRRDEWFKELADALDQLASEVEGFKVERLTRNEAFVSAAIQATRAAASTHHRDKREYLRNALLNIAAGKGPSEELQQIFIDAIEAFSASHMKVLNFLRTGDRDLSDRGLWSAASPYDIRDVGKGIRTLHPELAGQDGFVRYIMTDLRNWGFTNLGGPDDPFPLGSDSITIMGIEFLHFLLNPKDVQK